MRTTHAAVAQLRGRLWEETAAEPESDLRRELESMGPGRAASLETLMAERRAVLLSSRPGEEAHPNPNPYPDLNPSLHPNPDPP